MKGNGHGGARPGSGVPHGYKQQKTLIKEAARDAVAQVTHDEAIELVKSQIAKAKGIRFLVVRTRRPGSSSG